MRYFIVANSFAAPFFSDGDARHVEAPSPRKAIIKYRSIYGHPCGLYAAMCYASADDFHDNSPALAKWLCNHEIAKERATKGKGSYAFLGHGPGDFEVDHKRIKVKNPKGGRFVSVSEKKKLKTPPPKGIPHEAITGDS